MLTVFRLMGPADCSILAALMEERIRAAARKHLPGQVRRPLGALAGKFNSAVVQSLKGLIFDLQGGWLHIRDTQRYYDAVVSSLLFERGV